MQTAIHPLIEAHAGEPVVLTFTLQDGAGAPVDATAAAVTYKIARRAGDAAWLVRSNDDGIVIDAATITVSFDTGDLRANGVQALGDFFGQLAVTIGEDTLIAAEGPLTVHPVIVS